MPNNTIATVALWYTPEQPNTLFVDEEYHGGWGVAVSRDDADGGRYQADLALEVTIGTHEIDAVILHGFGAIISDNSELAAQALYTAVRNRVCNTPALSYYTDMR